MDYPICLVSKTEKEGILKILENSYKLGYENKIFTKMPFFPSDYIFFFESNLDKASKEAFDLGSSVKNLKNLSIDVEIIFKKFFLNQTTKS